MVEKFIANSKVIKEIKSSIKEDRLPHAIMLISSDNDLLDIYAEVITKLLLCPIDGGVGPCNTCDKIEKAIHLDAINYGKEKPMMAEDATDIVANLSVMPYEGDRKVYIFHNYDDSSEVVENKLLKSIEEPPTFVYFIILVKNKSKVLETTLSRCLRFELPELTKEELTEYIKGFGKENAEELAVVSAGKLVEANRNINSKNSVDIYGLVSEVMLNLKKTTDLLKYISKIEKQKDKLSDIISCFEIFVNDLIKYKVNELSLVQNKLREKEYAEICSYYSLTALSKFEDAIRSARRMFEAKAISASIIDQLLLKLVEVRIKCKK